MPTRPKMSPLQRLEATYRVLLGESPTTLAREYGVTTGRIYHLKDEALARSSRDAEEWVAQGEREARMRRRIAELGPLG